MRRVHQQVGLVGEHAHAVLDAPRRSGVGGRQILGCLIARLIRPGRHSRTKRLKMLAHRVCLRLAVRHPRFRHAITGQALVAACVGVHLAAVHRRVFARNKASLHAAAHDLLEHGTEHVAVAEAAMPIFAESAVVRHDVVHAKAAKPAMGQVKVHAGAEFALGADAAEVAEEQHADETAARLGAVTLSGLIRLEARLVLAGVRHETVPAYATHHAARHRTMLRPPILRQSRCGSAGAPSPGTRTSSAAPAHA